MPVWKAARPAADHVDRQKHGRPLHRPTEREFHELGLRAISMRGRYELTVFEFQRCWLPIPRKQIAIPVERRAWERRKLRRSGQQSWSRFSDTPSRAKARPSGWDTGAAP